MKSISTLGVLATPILLLLSMNSVADTSPETQQQIDSACLRQAISLANQLKSEVYSEMDSTQTNKIVKLATNTCKQQFSQIDAASAVAAKQDSANSNSGDSSGESILDTILSGDTTRKEGNKRLKNLKR